jgi:hypothetical protein
MPAVNHSHGFSLMEIMIGVFLSTILTTGIVQLVSGSVTAYRLQLSQSQLEESIRYARDVLVTQIAQAGYQSDPWLNPAVVPALTDEALNGGLPQGDQLGLQRRSTLNCYGNENPVKGDDGRPVFYLLQVRFRVNTGNNLAITCRYGPDASRLTTQINNFGLVEDVESMQVLYAEDRDGDDIADHWVTAQAWQKEKNIRAVKIGLLLATRQAFTEAVSTRITLLDETITTPADGHLRRVATITTAIRGRL